MIDAWRIARLNFTDDDGSLPGLEFTRLLPESIRKIFQYFRDNGRIVSKNPTLYDKVRQMDVPLGEANDPAGLVLEGVVDYFGCCFGGISQDSVSIPELGLFVFRDHIEIDFRMGAEWDRENVDAFFKLLAHLKTLAPEAIVGSADTEGLLYPEEFMVALDLYTRTPR